MFRQWFHLHAEPAQNPSSQPVASYNIHHSHPQPRAVGDWKSLGPPQKLGLVRNCLDWVARNHVVFSANQCSPKDAATRSAYCTCPTRNSKNFKST